MFSILKYVSLLIYATFVGTLIGVIGIGGGVLLLPFLLYLNFTIQQAVAVTLFLSAVPNTLPALYMYYREGFFLIKPSVVTALGTIIGVIIGGYVGSKELIPKIYIYRFYTAFLLVLSIYMFFYYC